jgi:L-malate glycosyltransferase
MRILWITNTIFPAPSKAFGFPYPVVGGWMYALEKQLKLTKDIKLAIATVYKGQEIKSIEIDGVLYYLLPSKLMDNGQESLGLNWKNICNEFNPDIIHIHGTEHTHGLECMRSCPEMNYVISIQGLISICSRYYYAGIKQLEIIKHITIRDIIRLDSLFQANKNFGRRGIFEKEFIKRSQHIIGRTSWDYTHAKTINPKINYHFCNEILRDSFYNSSKWNVNHKNEFTIFLSQATEPLKGLHQVIKAVALLKEDFPEIKIRIAGQNILRNTSLLERFKRGGYGSYLQNMIVKFKLQKHICFTGTLGEEQMVAEYKNAHIFICPSSIENSPNSLGEAQLIGVPTISAYVGGIPDMVTHGESGLLYRFEEVEMLAENIREIFTNDNLAVRLSINGTKAAEKRHNIQINVGEMIKIYNKVSLLRLNLKEEHGY